ncbi:MAG TPA: dienelactone hydrolase family protein [Alphaproteobacteria bacterium]|nr:phospholipase [Rhodospirillaceae bacterium]HRJ11665.1 dienelactone hydrolase family protein [Alphaproteobacteria bacterium]
MLSGPQIPPQSGNAKQLVVFIHGYGADGNDLIGLAPYFAALLPDALFISPHGWERCEMGMGRQWFSLGGWQPGLDWPAKAWDEILSCGKMLNGWLDATLAENNIAPENLALIGFSQGTMMSLHVGLRRVVPPAAILGYSGALMGQSVLSEEIISRPPVLLVHGEQDPIVSFSEMASAEKKLKELNVPVQTYARPGLPHGIDDEGIARGAQFLAAAFGAT